jgi:hypothetical protein
MESVRRDQIVYRFYVKTLGVLADARLEFPAAVEDGKGQVRIDKWVSCQSEQAVEWSEFQID